MLENITPTMVFNWTVVLSLLFCLFLGFFAFGGPLYKYLRSNIGGIFGFSVMFLGIVLLTTPKWTEIAIKFGEFEGKISTLENQKAQLEAQAKLQNTKIASLETTLAAFTEAKQKDIVSLAVAAAVANVHSSEIILYKPISGNEFNVVLGQICAGQFVDLPEVEVLNCSVDPSDMRNFSTALVKGLKRAEIDLYRKASNGGNMSAGMEVGTWLVGGDQSKNWSDVVQAVGMNR